MAEDLKVRGQKLFGISSRTNEYKYHRRFMSYEHSKFAFSVECYSATIWPIVTSFASSPFGMTLYQPAKFRENRLHGSARTAFFGGRRRRRRRKKLTKNNKVSSFQLDPLIIIIIIIIIINIAASSDKTGSSWKHRKYGITIESCKCRIIFKGVSARN